MILIVFVVILSANFALMALLMGSSHGDKAFERRLGVITARKSGETSNIQIGQLLKTDSASRLAWFDEFLQKYRLSKTLKSRIVQSNSNISVAMLLVFSIGLALFGFSVAYMCISVTAVQMVAACTLGYVPFGIISFRRSRRIAAFNAGLPDAIDMMGRALRAGHSMISSINTVAEQSAEPVSSEFRGVFKQQNFGLPLREALTQMLDHVPSQDLRVLVTGILVQKESGGNLAEILERTATVIRERLRIQGEIKTHTAQGRMTGWVLCSLPVVMLVAINMINPGYSTVLINTPMGHKIIYVGLTLLAVGAAIIRSIINGIEV